MSRWQRGFSLLEVMLASLVLMLGILGAAQLHRSMLSGFSPDQASGVNQHPAIVENLLRDQVEQARNAPPANLPALTTPHGTYQVTVTPLGGANGGVRVSRQRYEVLVRYQAVGAAAPTVAGRVIFDKVTGGAGRTGL